MIPWLIRQTLTILAMLPIAWGIIAVTKLLAPSRRTRRKRHP